MDIITKERGPLAIKGKPSKVHEDFLELPVPLQARTYVFGMPSVNVDHETSRSLLNHSGLELYSSAELLPLLIRSRELQDGLKGAILCLSDNGITKDGLYTCDQENKITEVPNPDEVDINHLVAFCKGPYRPYLFVVSDKDLKTSKARFMVSANELPSVKANVVIGKPIGQGHTKYDKVTEAIAVELQKVKESKAGIKGDIKTLESKLEDLESKEKDLNASLLRAKKIEEEIKDAQLSLTASNDELKKIYNSVLRSK